MLSGMYPWWLSLSILPTPDTAHSFLSYSAYYRFSPAQFSLTVQKRGLKHHYLHSAHSYIYIYIYIYETVEKERKRRIGERARERKRTERERDEFHDCMDIENNLLTNYVVSETTDHQIYIQTVFFVNNVQT